MAQKMLPSAVKYGSVTRTHPLGVVMKSMGFRFSVVFAAVVLATGLFGTASAQQLSQRQVRDLCRSLSSQVDNFRYVIEDDMQRSSADRRDINDVSQSLENLQSTVLNLEDNVGSRRDNRDDVNEVITAAQDIEGFFRRQPLNQRIQQNWGSIKDTIGRLAANYGVTPSWSGRVSAVPPTQTRRSYPSGGNGPVLRQAPARATYPSVASNSQASSGLTGTYRLNASKSENTDQILSETNVAGAQRQDLQKKLEAPDQIAIDVRGAQVTLATSNSSPITFIADGTEKGDTDASGKAIRVRASLRGDELTIASLGGDTDYTIILTPTDGGRALKVTRRITTEYLTETVFADSVYEKTNDIALLGIDTGDNSIAGVSSSSDNTGSNGGWSSSDNSQPGQPNNQAAIPGRTGDFVVPNGTVITAMLDSTIDTKLSQNNDRFKMTVQSPMQFRGAVIEGHITGVGRSGRVSGRSNVTFNFDTITLRDGKTYDFSGFLQSIKDQNGKTVKVDAEGTIKGDSQTKETMKRGGAGAGLGAVIGAIAGGGTGAAIGAIIGGSVGAGSVVVQGRDDLQLYKGSTITIQASSPIRGEQQADN
jgi:hypothetical protein